MEWRKGCKLAQGEVSWWPPCSAYVLLGGRLAQSFPVSTLTGVAIASLVGLIILSSGDDTYGEERVSLRHWRMRRHVHSAAEYGHIGMGIYGNALSSCISC